MSGLKPTPTGWQIRAQGSALGIFDQVSNCTLKGCQKSYRTSIPLKSPKVSKENAAGEFWHPFRVHFFARYPVIPGRCPGLRSGTPLACCALKMAKPQSPAVRGQMGQPRL